MRKKVIKNKKKNGIITFIALVTTIITIRLAWAFYFQRSVPALKTSFKTEITEETKEYGPYYLRATYLTYWISSNTSNIVGKDKWELDESNISSNWTKIGDYFYYNEALDKDSLDIKEVPLNLPEKYYLIDKNKTVSDVSVEDLSLNTDSFLPRYQIIYEILVKDEDTKEDISEDAWSVIYVDNKLSTTP